MLSLINIPFIKGIKILYKSHGFLFWEVLKLFLLFKESKPPIKVMLSFFQIPFIGGIETLYKSHAFPDDFAIFCSERAQILMPNHF